MTDTEFPAVAAAAAHRESPASPLGTTWTRAPGLRSRSSTHLVVLHRFRAPARRGSCWMLLRGRRVSLDELVQYCHLRRIPAAAARRGPWGRADSGRNLRRRGQRFAEPRAAHARHSGTRRLRRSRLRGHRDNVADLAQALATQPLRSGSDPVPVRVAGYGLYVETSVPAHVDFTTCKGAPSTAEPARATTRATNRGQGSKTASGSSTSTDTDWSSTAGTCPGPPRRKSTRSRRW